MLTQVSKYFYDWKREFIFTNKTKPLFLGITTDELDSLLAETAAYLNILHPDFGRLAARVAVTSLHKKTKAKFSETIDVLYGYKGVNGENASLIAEDVYQIV